MPQKISNYFHTIIHLKPKQVIYRLYFFLSKKKNKSDYIYFIPRQSHQLVMSDSVVSYTAYSEKNIFSFLNQTHQFYDKIDWNYTDYGMLWAYNLNYFEFLHQPIMDKEIGLRLIYDYIEQYRNIRIGYDPYPISLRNIFWIRFLSKYEIHDEKIDSFLYDTYTILLHHLEYHLLGNHLLENAFSLLFGSYYFHDMKLYKKAHKILEIQLEEQILKDGGHFELSPMYHQILLYRLLDCINLISNNKWENDDLFNFLCDKAAYMLSWLRNMTLPAGNIPYLNDSSSNIAPSSAELFEYAQRLGIPYKEMPLSDSNYRIFRGDNYTCICDIGGISPDYQCGHAHADTFNFVLEVNGKPVIVDTGCSTYEKNQIRFFERCTSAHNTVVVNKNSSSYVWASHRVGKRARVMIIEDTPHSIIAQHSGYSGNTHIRFFTQKDNMLKIFDEVKGKKSRNIALFHIDNGIKDISIHGNTVDLLDVQVSFEGSSAVYISDYEQPLGFNKRVKALCVCVDFDRKLKTVIMANTVA